MYTYLIERQSLPTPKVMDILKIVHSSVCERIVFRRPVTEKFDRVVTPITYALLPEVSMFLALALFAVFSPKRKSWPKLLLLNLQENILRILSYSVWTARRTR